MTLDRRRFLTLAAGGVAAATLASCASSDADGTSTGAAPNPDPTDDAGTGSPPRGTGDSSGGNGGGNGPDDPTTPGGTVGTWVVSGPSTSSQVALTFHTNGPTSMVESVLDIVEARKLAITTFIIGQWLDANPSMGERIVAGGHDLANHTYTHPTFEELSPAQMQTEIERCRDALVHHAGSPGRWFRPSGTDNGVDSPSAATLAAAGAAGYTSMGYDVDPFDYRDPGAAAVIERTLAGVVGGSVVSLHMGHQGTIDALPALLDGLDTAGLEPVTLSTLLGSG